MAALSVGSPAGDQAGGRPRPGAGPAAGHGRRRRGTGESAEGGVLARQQGGGDDPVFRDDRPLRPVGRRRGGRGPLVEAGRFRWRTSWPDPVPPAWRWPWSAPTTRPGRSSASATWERVATARPGALVLLDHAYVEFADEDLTRSVLDLPNLVVFRTLSKAWGCAGLRVGYAVGDSRPIGWMPLGRPALLGGVPVPGGRRCAACGWARPTRDRFVRRVRSERSRLGELLCDLGARVPSITGQLRPRPATLPSGGSGTALPGSGSRFAPLRADPELEGWVEGDAAGRRGVLFQARGGPANDSRAPGPAARRGTECSRTCRAPTERPSGAPPHQFGVELTAAEIRQGQEGGGRGQ